MGKSSDPQFTGFQGFRRSGSISGTALCAALSPVSGPPMLFLLSFLQIAIPAGGAAGQQ